MRRSNRQNPGEMEKAIKLLALTALRELKQKEKVELLDQAGYGPQEIAGLLATTPKAVSVRLAEIRRARRLKKTAKGDKLPGEE